MDNEKKSYCETCRDFHSDDYHKQIFPFYEDYRLIQMKGLIKDLPFMTLNNFRRTYLRVERHIDKYAKKGKMTYDDGFIKLIKHVNERYDRSLKGIKYRQKRKEINEDIDIRLIKLLKKEGEKLRFNKKRDTIIEDKDMYWIKILIERVNNIH